MFLFPRKDDLTDLSAYSKEMVFVMAISVNWIVRHSDKATMPSFLSSLLC